MAEMQLSLRTWLLIKALEHGATFYEAQEAVATTMLSWKSSGLVADPNLRTYAEWQRRYEQGSPSQAVAEKPEKEGTDEVR